MIKYLILDTRKLLIALEKNVLSISTFKVNELNIILLLCDILTNEDIAYEELSRNYLYESNVDSDEFHLNHIVSTLGLELFKYLQKIKAYENGKLPFIYHAMIGHDVVLKRSINNAL